MKEIDLNAQDKSSRKTILIVDDSSESIAVLSNALPEHYKCQVALSGTDALKLLEESSKLPDLILLDVLMPDMDGYEVCRRLKKDERLMKIPIIFLSALTDVEDKIKAFQNGGVDYIQKPFELLEVQARVKTHLNLYELQMELENRNVHLNQMVENKVKEISDSQLAMIYGFTKLAESRDDETGEHIERVLVFCQLMAEKLSLFKNITMEFINNIEKASPLHDIGKVGIRDSILLKPGKLTGIEFEEMKHHTTIGANMLWEVYKKYPNNYFIKIGIEIAQSHHEKWNGSGYPDGLRGEEIPLSARIMAIVDVYDALRSERVYKEAYTHEKACSIISEGRGVHFEPLIADVFIKHSKEFEEVYNTLSQ